MAKNIGVYLCGGCGLADAIDLEKLAKVSTREGKAAVTRTHAMLCGAEGLAAIREDLAGGAADTVVVAACSPRMKTDAFAGFAAERVNLREHVAWCHKPKDEDTQMAAEDYLRMGIARARKSEVPKPLAEAVSRTILVVGGGASGVAAALEAAEAGCAVVLVEQQAQLGGFAADLKSRFSDGQDGDLRQRISTVLYHPGIRVLTGARIVRTTGQPGMFDVTVATDLGENAAGEIAVRVGAIVVAAGWKPYDAAKLGHLGYGTVPNVITNVELERMAAAGPILRPSDGKPAESVLFVQCAGSRDAAHLPYCSSVCCMATLKHATYIREQNPKARVFVIYRDMRTPGQYERFYRQVQDQPLNFFTKGEVTEVKAGSDGKVAVTVDHTLMGGDVELHVDLVVLATGMVPAEANDETRILNLEYRQGPELPVLRSGFPDSHFVCFPYETQRTGIYAAGAARAPMDAAHAAEDAAGAAMKAIQAVEMASRGQAALPRAGDTSYPSFFLQRCTQCKRCTEECPFGALDEDAKGTPKPNLLRCRRCGICMGACPERIVSFQNYSVDMIATMIKAIEVPEEDEEKPRVLAFLCENDAYPALDLAGLNRVQYDASVRVIPLRCLGSLNIVWIADALSRGIDGVMLVGCKYGDDYQCHFIRGSELANRRMENVRETLQRLRLEPERIQVTQLAINEYGKLPALIDGFVARMREIGPNPYKGF